MAAAIPLMPRRPRSQCSHQRPQRPRRGGQREANLLIRGFDPRPITPLVSNSARGDQDRSSSLPQPPRRLSPEGVYLTWGTPEATLGESAELVLYIFFFFALTCPSSKRVSRAGSLAGSPFPRCVSRDITPVWGCYFLLGLYYHAPLFYGILWTLYCKTGIPFVFICIHFIIIHSFQSTLWLYTYR